jgi:hypothetical protein
MSKEGPICYPGARSEAESTDRGESLRRGIYKISASELSEYVMAAFAEVGGGDDDALLRSLRTREDCDFKFGGLWAIDEEAVSARAQVGEEFVVAVAGPILAVSQQ